jgi:hypothetical protein
MMRAASIRLRPKARGIPVLKRESLAAALLAAFCFVCAPAQAQDDLGVVFATAPGERSTFDVSYWRGGSYAGKPTPVTVITYDLGVEIKSASAEGIVATVTSNAVDITVNGQRVLTPPDFDSLLYLAADGVPIDVKMSPDGIIDEVADWDSVKAALTARVAKTAADNESLRRTADEFFASLTPVTAAEIFARPLALSAAGRIVKLEAPARRSVEAKGVALPSFTTNAKGNWTFSLVDAPSKNRLPGAVTIEWLGVPNAEDLRAILRTVAEQFSEIEPENAPALAVIERDARMWQRFLASYDPKTGQLLEMSGQMELVAGPIQRKVAIEAVTKPE